MDTASAMPGAGMRYTTSTCARSPTCAKSLCVFRPRPRRPCPPPPTTRISALEGRRRNGRCAHARRHTRAQPQTLMPIDQSVRVSAVEAWLGRSATCATWSSRTMRLRTSAMPSCSSPPRSSPAHTHMRARNIRARALVCPGPCMLCPCSERARARPPRRPIHPGRLGRRFRACGRRIASQPIEQLRSSAVRMPLRPQHSAALCCSPRHRPTHRAGRAVAVGRRVRLQRAVAARGHHTRGDAAARPQHGVLFGRDGRYGSLAHTLAHCRNGPADGCARALSHSRARTR